MELTIPAICTILSLVFCIATFVVNRKDKAVENTKKEVEKNKDETKEDALLNYRLTQVENKLDKILEKLDRYDKEVQDKIDKAIENHILTYHKRSKKGEL